VWSFCIFTTMEPYVKHFIDASCGTLEFGNPAGNSLPTQLLNDLLFQFQQLKKHPEVKTIVLQSAGNRAFCGGASFSEMKSLKTAEEATAFFMGFARIINAIRTSDKFVVVRVQGKVVGGGVGLVAACDYAIAQESAQVKLSELSIGLGPYVIEPAVSRKIGPAAFAHLSLEAESWKSALWAEEKGLYNKVVATEEELNRQVKETAQRLSSYAPEAIKNLRALHWKNTDHWETLLPNNAKITANLLLNEATQIFLNSL